MLAPFSALALEIVVREFTKKFTQRQRILSSLNGPLFAESVE